MGAEDQLKAAQASLTQNETLIKNAQAILANPKSTPSAISNAKRTIEAAQFNVGVYRKRVQDAFVFIARERAVQAQKEAEQQRQKEAQEAQKAIQIEKELRARQQAEQEQEQMLRLEKKAEEERIKSQQILQMAEQVKQPDVQREEALKLEQQELTRGIASPSLPSGLEGVKIQQEELIFRQAGGPEQKEFFQGEVLKKEIPEEEGSFENIVGRFTEIQKKAQKTSEEANYLKILKDLAIRKAKTPQELEVARGLPEAEAVILGGSAVPFPYETTGYFQETKEYYIDPATGKRITGTGIAEIGALRDIGGFQAPETLAIVESYEKQPPSLAEQIYGVAPPKKTSQPTIPTVPVRPIQPTLQQDPLSIITGAGLQPTSKSISKEFFPTDKMDTKSVFVVPSGSAGVIAGAPVVKQSIFETDSFLSDLGKSFGIKGDLFSSITKDLTPFTQTEKEFKATEKARKAKEKTEKKAQIAEEEKLLKQYGVFREVKSTGVVQYGGFGGATEQFKTKGGTIFDDTIMGLIPKVESARKQSKSEFAAEAAQKERERQEAKAREEARHRIESQRRIPSKPPKGGGISLDFTTPISVQQPKPPKPVGGGAKRQRRSRDYLFYGQEDLFY